MESKTNLTIQDYFKNTNVRLKRQPALNQPGASGSRQRDRFGQILASTQTTSKLDGGSKPRGLTIEAYRSLAPRAFPSRPEESPGGDQSAESSGSSEMASPDVTPAQDGTTAVSNASSASGLRRRHTLARSQSTENSSRIQEKISRSIETAAKKFNLTPDLLHAMVKTESNYEVRAVSPAGAQGLMQLMPETAKDLGVTNPFDIDQNINGGAQYMRWMLDRFDGDLDLALAAYNAGPETVNRHGGQVPPYRETQNYIRRVMRHSNRQIG